MIIHKKFKLFETSFDIDLKTLKNLYKIMIG